MGGISKKGRQSSNCNKSHLNKHIRDLKKYKTTSEANIRSVKTKKRFNPSSEELKGRIVTMFGKFGCLMEGISTGLIFSWLVLWSCQNPSSRGFRLGSLKHRNLSLLIMYGKLALTCFLCCWIWRGRKNKQMELQWMGLWKRQQP